jgi:hypothetical protein
MCDRLFRRRPAGAGHGLPVRGGDIFVRAVDYISDPEFTEDEAHAILEGNATALFGISAPVSGATA